MKKRLLVILLALLIGWAAYWSYTFMPIFQSGYKDSYSKEDVNNKILSFQKLLIEAMEKEAQNNVVDFEKGFTRSWGFTVDAAVESQVWSGSMEMSIPDYKIVMKWQDFDISFKDMMMNLDISSMMVSEKSTIDIPDLHTINNEEGMFLKMSAINIDAEDSNILSLIPKEYIETLNKVWKTGKYLEMTKDDSVNDFMRQVSAGNESLDAFSSIMKLAKTEPLFEVYKQEWTKYYIGPSKISCKIAKWNTLDRDTDNNQYISKDWGFTNLPEPQHYLIDNVDFNKLEEYENCSQEEYDTFVKTTLWHDLPDNSSKAKINIYIEMNKTKTRIVSELKNKEILTSMEVMVWLTEVSSVKFETNFLSKAVTWSGILIESEGSTISGYIDIEDVESWSNIDISMNPWEEENTFIIWSYTFREENSPNITGTINWEITSGDMNAKLIMNISAWDVEGFSSKNTIDIKTSFSEESYSWNIDINSTVSMPWNPKDIASTWNLAWELLKINKKKIEKQIQEELEAQLKAQEEEEKQRNEDFESRKAAFFWDDWDVNTFDFWDMETITIDTWDIPKWSTQTIEFSSVWTFDISDNTEIRDMTDEELEDMAKQMEKMMKDTQSSYPDYDYDYWPNDE